MLDSATACVCCKEERPESGRLLDCLHVLCESCLRDQINPLTGGICCTMCGRNTVTESTQSQAADESITRMPLGGHQRLVKAAGLLYHSQSSEASGATAPGPAAVAGDQEGGGLKCSIHHGQLLSLYCKTCDRLACGMCGSSHLDHDHVVASTRKVCREKRCSVEELLESVSSIAGLSDVKLLDLRLRNLTTATEQVNQQAEEASEKVKEYFKELRSVLDEEEQRLYSEIDQHRWRTQQHLEDEQQRVHNKRNTLSSIKAIGEKLTQSLPQPSKAITPSDIHVMLLHGSLAEAATTLSPEDLNIPVAQLVGKFGVTIAENSTDGIRTTLKGDARAFHTVVDVMQSRIKNLGKQPGSEEFKHKLKFALRDHAGNVLHAKQVPEDFEASMMFPTGDLQRLRLSADAAKVGVWESDLFLTEPGGYPIHLSSAERTRYPWISTTTKRVFTDPLTLQSLTTPGQDHVHVPLAEVVAGNTAVAVSKCAFSGASRNCWSAQVKWQTQHNIFMGVAPSIAASADGAASGNSESSSIAYGWWSANTVRHGHVDQRTADLNELKSGDKIVITLDLQRKRLELLIAGMKKCEVLDMSADCATPGRAWHPVFCLSNEDESISVI
eukprot:scpid44621/ scgid21904/ 